jgi:regulator of protease activity HflC (stomatin/prohibitin superfamily)
MVTLEQAIQNRVAELKSEEQERQRLQAEKQKQIAELEARAAAAARQLLETENGFSLDNLIVEASLIGDIGEANYFEIDIYFPGQSKSIAPRNSLMLNGEQYFLQKNNFYQVNGYKFSRLIDAIINISN